MAIAGLDVEAAFNLLHAWTNRAQDQTGMTPLTAAVYSRNVGLVRLMLECGHTTEDRSMLFSPIGGAISMDQESQGETILKMLLETLPPLSIDHPRHYCGELNEPMLHAAIRRKRVGMIKILMQHGARLEWRDTDGVSGEELAKTIGVEF